MATSAQDKKAAKAAPVETVTVRAIAEGYDNVAVRQPGDVFELPKKSVDDALKHRDKDGKPTAWFELVED